MECFKPRVINHIGTVPCGQCLACLHNRSSHWQTRLKIEYGNSITAYFVTLTYEDTFLPVAENGVPVLRPKDVQDWLKRLRKAISPIKLRFYLCGEYGTKTLRPHYHAILFIPRCEEFDFRSFGLKQGVSDSIPSGPEFDIRTFEAFDRTIKATWKRGFTVLAPVSESHFKYVAKYVSSYSKLPEFYKDYRYRPFSRCSLRPAIGYSFLDSPVVDFYRRTPRPYIRQGDTIVSMPRYYRNKIYDDDMRATLADQAYSYRYANHFDIDVSTLSHPFSSPRADREKVLTRQLSKSLFKNKPDSL